VKIKSVMPNNRRRSFEIIVSSGKAYQFPYAKLETPPSPADRIVRAYPDPELAREAFTYVLESGAEESVHIDSVLEYNEDPEHLNDLLLYQLTLEAERRVAKSGLSKRELTRRLRTSAAQLYRLLDPTNTRKSLGQMIALLRALGCDVELIVKKRAA
jgi:hypothetical protein